MRLAHAPLLRGPAIAPRPGLDAGRRNGHASPMRRLPLRPAIFIGAWLALFLASSAATFAGPPLSDLLYMPVLGALLLLQVAWTWQAARFAAGVLAARGQPQRAKRFDMATNVLAGAVLAASIGMLVALPQGLSSPEPPLALLSLVVPVGALGSFALDLVAAAAICAAERVVGGGSPHVLGTFIQFVYVILAAPFLHRRLRRLDGEAPAPSAA